MGKYKKIKSESDHFVSASTLICRFALGFLVLAVIGTTGVLVGYYFGFLDAMSTESNSGSSTETPTDTTRAAIDPVGIAEPTPGTYLIGVGRSDLTGPIVQVNMMGYANPAQVSAGLHQRLYARAFVVSDNNRASRVAFVTVDSGMASQVVKLEVIKRLQAKYGKLYTERNVVISGTHSHSGPAGFFQTMLVEVTSLGAVNQTTEVFISGIVDSIAKAHSSMKEGKMLFGTGDVVEGNINRSPSAYLKNPSSERAGYQHNTEHEMSMLKFETTAGHPLGMFSWYPVHGTSMNFTNQLISSDNRGRASALFEKWMRQPNEKITGNESFVGAFASANLGDVSPRTKGPICVDSGLSCDFEKSTCDDPPRVKNCVAFGPGVDMFDSTDIIANRQFEEAKLIYNKSHEQLVGSVGWVHQYVDMTKEVVTLDDGRNVTTCKPGMGYSFAAGTTDGAGAFDFTQSMTEGTLLWDSVRDFIITPVVCSTPPPSEYYNCHHPKPVLLPTGYMDKPYAWQPTIIDVQMLKIGQLIIIAVPGEFTTMAGRRIKDAVRKEAIKHGVSGAKVVLSGLSNVYTHYITTPEEYTAQRYEGGSTIFGPHTFQAYLQKYSSLVQAMVTGAQSKVPPGPPPANILKEQVEFLPPPSPDSVPDGHRYGDVIVDANGTFASGDLVSATFYGANPRHNMKIGRTYLTVDRMVNGSWEVVYVDTDWSTLFRWNDVFTKSGTEARERNVITALFDVIGASLGARFDYEKAMTLYERGQLEVPQSLYDVIDKSGRVGRHRRTVRDLEKRGVLQLTERFRPNLKLLPAVESHVTIDWYVPDDQPSGTYRLTYYGDRKENSGTVTPFIGHSSPFKVSN